MCGIEAFQRENWKDAGFDGKEIYKYPHIWVENHSHSLLHMRNEKQINLRAKDPETHLFCTSKAFHMGKSLCILRVLHPGYLYKTHINRICSGY